MPRFDKFFEGAAAGIPQGYRMGLAYQEEQRAKAQDARAAEMHGRQLKAADQLHSHNAVMYPLLQAQQSTSNEQAAHNLSIAKQFDAKAKQSALDVEQFNLRRDKTQFDQEQKNLKAIADSFTNLYGFAPGGKAWAEFLSGPAPKNPEALKMWKQGKVVLENPGFKNAFAAIRRLDDLRGQGISEETYKLVTGHLEAGLKSGGEQSFEVFEGAHARAMASGNPAAHNAMIGQVGVGLSGLTLREGFFTNTEIDDSGAVTTFKVFPQYKDGQLLGYRREQWKTYSPEDVQSGAMRRDMMSWGVGRKAPSEEAKAAADEALRIRGEEAKISAQEAKGAGSGDGAVGATERMKELGEIAKNNPKVYQIFSELTDDEFSRVSGMLGNMGGDSLNNLMTAIKAVKLGLKVVKRGDRIVLKNPVTGAETDPQYMPL